MFSVSPLLAPVADVCKSEVLDPDFYHSGGGRQSFYPPMLVGEVAPQTLNASEAAAIYPAQWPEKVFAWNMTFSNDARNIANGTVVCLCEAKYCGCGPEAWAEVNNFDGKGASIELSANEFAVNGTALQEDIDEEMELKDKQRNATDVCNTIAMPMRLSKIKLTSRRRRT
jgi:hypothetical protein